MYGEMHPEHIPDYEGKQAANHQKRKRANSAFPRFGDSSKYAWSVAKLSV